MHYNKEMIRFGETVDLWGLKGFDSWFCGW